MEEARRRLRRESARIRSWSLASRRKERYRSRRGGWGVRSPGQSWSPSETRRLESGLARVLVLLAGWVTHSFDSQSSKSDRLPQRSLSMRRRPYIPRRRWTTSATLFSWNKRMAAIPAAPASRQDFAFSSVMPPKATTGMCAPHASRTRLRPAGGASFFSKTGAKTAKVAWFAAARVTSAGE